MHNANEEVGFRVGWRTMPCWAAGGIISLQPWGEKSVTHSVKAKRYVKNDSTTIEMCQSKRKSGKVLHYVEIEIT
jgi:hypothetical protein